MNLTHVILGAGAIALVGFMLTVQESNGFFPDNGSGTALYAEARPILDSYGGNNVQLNVVEPKTNCGVDDSIVACAILSEDKMYLNSNFEDSGMSLKAVIAHEYVHTLTSPKEADWLYENVHVPGIDSTEVIADCGVVYFVDSDSPDFQLAYMTGRGCTKEQVRIAGQVINNERLG